MDKEARCPRCKNKTLLLIYPAQVHYKLTELIRHSNDIDFRYEGKPDQKVLGDPLVSCAHCGCTWPTIVDCYAEIAEIVREDMQSSGETYCSDCSYYSDTDHGGWCAAYNGPIQPDEESCDSFKKPEDINKIKGELELAKERVKRYRAVIQEIDRMCKEADNLTSDKSATKKFAKDISSFIYQMTVE